MHSNSVSESNLTTVSISMWYPFFFLLSTIFYFIFLQTIQHNIQNKTKQNSRHILNIQKFNQKGWRERQQEHKTHFSKQSRTFSKKHCQASIVEGLAPPTRAVVHSHEMICRRLRIQYASLHMCGVNQF